MVAANDLFFFKEWRLSAKTSWMDVATSIWTWAPTQASRYGSFMNLISSQMPRSCQSLTSSLGRKERGLFHEEDFWNCLFQGPGEHLHSWVWAKYHAQRCLAWVGRAISRLWMAGQFGFDLTALCIPSLGESVIANLKFQDTSRHF